MTTEEIQQHIDEAISSHFDNYTSESGEMMTSEGGDGRFVGKVIATRYSGLPVATEIFLAIGQTEQGGQIIKFGKSECLKPSKADLDMILTKQLGIELE